MRKNTAILFLVIAITLPLYAWGPTGHSIVADIAQSRLNPAAARAVRDLLGGNSLASIASWADDVRRDRDESYNWHFVDIPNGASGFNQQRDCFRPDDRHFGAKTDHHNCVVDRIEMFRDILADRNARREDRIDALEFVVHFLGDIHQPLHAVGEGRGGNDEKVSIFGTTDCGATGPYPCNLHSAWDDALIEHSGRTEPQYVAYLQEFIATNHLEQKAGGTPADWANESFQIARQIWLQDGGKIDESYYRAHERVLDERLALAGLRLAALLNNTLGSPAQN